MSYIYKDGRTIMPRYYVVPVKPLNPQSLDLKVPLFSGLFWSGSIPMSPYTGSRPFHKLVVTYAMLLCHHTHPDIAEATFDGDLDNLRQ